MADIYLIYQGVRSGEQSCTELAKILRIRWCTMFQIISKIFLREGIQKKWKFLMTFANKKKRAVSSSIRFLSNIVLLIDIFFWDFLRHVRTGRSCFLSMLTWKPSTPRKLKGWGKPWRRLTSESFVVLRLLLLWGAPQSNAEGQWHQNWKRNRPTNCFYGWQRKWIKIFICLENALYPKISNNNFFLFGGGEYPRNPYALRIPMYATDFFVRAICRVRIAKCNPYRKIDSSPIFIWFLKHLDKKWSVYFSLRLLLAE